MSNIVTQSTLLIEIATGKYPCRLSEVREAVYPATFAREPEEKTLIELGYGIVVPNSPPPGDVVTEGEPIASATPGYYDQGWNIRSFTPEELATNLEQAKLAATSLVDLRRNEALERGYKFTFEDETEGHIQLRDGDRVNVLAYRVWAVEAKAAGALDRIFTWRVRENVSKELMTEGMIRMADECGIQYEKIMNLAWVLKDQIAAATTIAEIPEVPEILAPQAS